MSARPLVIIGTQAPSARASSDRGQPSIAGLGRQRSGECRPRVHLRSIRATWSRTANVAETSELGEQPAGVRLIVAAGQPVRSDLLVGLIPVTIR
jgi:hypothetical protein